MSEVFVFLFYIIIVSFIIGRLRQKTSERPVPCSLHTWKYDDNSKQLYCEVCDRSVQEIQQYHSEDMWK